MDAVLPCIFRFVAIIALSTDRVRSILALPAGLACNPSRLVGLLTRWACGVQGETSKAVDVLAGACERSPDSYQAKFSFAVALHIIGDVRYLPISSCFGMHSVFLCISVHSHVCVRMHECVQVSLRGILTHISVCMQTCVFIMCMIQNMYINSIIFILSCVNRTHCGIYAYIIHVRYI